MGGSGGVHPSVRNPSVTGSLVLSRSVRSPASRL